jgi:hypothetical protein
MAMGYRCFTQELRIQIPTLKRVPESASELFLECVFVRPSWRKLKVRIDIWVRLRTKGGENRCLCSARHLFLVGVDRRCCLTLTLPVPRTRNNQVLPVRRAGFSCSGASKAYNG